VYGFVYGYGYGLILRLNIERCMGMGLIRRFNIEREGLIRSVLGGRFVTLEIWRHRDIEGVWVWVWV
jgi:hypothetical protein